MNDQDYTHTEMEPEDFSMGGNREPAEEPIGDEAPQKGNAKIVVSKDEEIFLEHEVFSTPVTIGRKSENTIVLEEKNVSRKHAQIILKEDQYFVEDLGSTGGTKVNGEAVTEKDIHTGDVIQIGNYTLKFDSGIPEDERTVFEDEKTMMEEGTALDEDRTMYYEEPEARLVVEKSDTLEADIVLEEDDTVFGREEGDVIIEDKRLSRKHCKISKSGTDFILTDLGSTNGTFINGQKVTEKTLESGDRIQIGSNILIFRIESAMAPKKKGRLAVLGIAAVSLIILIFVAYVGSKIISGGKETKVILQKAWELQTSAGVSASLSLGDINGDGYLNMIAADLNGTVYGLDGRQGGLIWNSEYKSRGGAILSDPLLVDINETDGKLDVVIGTATKGVLAIDGGTMRQIWLAGIGVPVSTPLAAADINNDGTNDVFVAADNGMISCLDGRQGGPFWRFSVGASIRTAPILADLNGDGISDVIVGSQNRRIHALDGKSGRVIWVHVGTDEPSTVDCADFTGDGTLDVAFATPREVIVLEGNKGALIWKWQLPETARSTASDPFYPYPPAIADLNKDKKQDVIASTAGGHVYAVDGASNGAQYLWDFGLSPARKTAPTLCDLNRDGISDVIVGDSDGNVIAIDGANGHELNRLSVGSPILTRPSVGDFTSNGTVDIAVGTKDNRIIAIETETKIKRNAIL